MKITTWASAGFGGWGLGDGVFGLGLGVGGLEFGGLKSLQNKQKIYLLLETMKHESNNKHARR